MIHETLHRKNPKDWTAVCRSVHVLFMLFMLFLYSDVQHFVLFMLFMLFLYSGVQHFVLFMLFMLFLYSDVQHFVLFMLFLYSGVQHFVLLYVFTFLVLCCPVLLRFLHKTISCSSLPSIGCRRAGALFMLFVFISYSVSHVLDIWVKWRESRLR